MGNFQDKLRNNHVEYSSKKTLPFIIALLIQKMNRSKKNYILIEILIAIILITSCLLPLTIDPIVSFAKNKSLWAGAQQEREARLFAASIREKLIQGEIPLQASAKLLEQGTWDKGGTYEVILIKAPEEKGSYHGVKLELKSGKKQKTTYQYYFLIKAYHDQKTPI